MSNLIIKGDCKEELKALQDESIHLTFTSPPYFNAKEYSYYESYRDYLVFLEEVFKEVHRVTKEGRYLVVNTSPVLIPRKSASHQSKRLPIPFDLNSILVKMGFMFLDDIIWVKPEASVKNRIANFLTIKTPLTYKPNLITEYIMVYRKGTDKLINWNLKQYTKEEKENSLLKSPEDYETSNVWKIAPISNKNHPAVFPVKLSERVIKLYSFKGDIVLDPFAGIFTTAISAIKTERQYIMIEKEEKYVEEGKNRIDRVKQIETVKLVNKTN